jgi:hypothetical protein
MLHKKNLGVGRGRRSLVGSGFVIFSYCGRDGLVGMGVKSLLLGIVEVHDGRRFVVIIQQLTVPNLVKGVYPFIRKLDPGIQKLNLC